MYYLGPGLEDTKFVITELTYFLFEVILVTTLYLLYILIKNYQEKEKELLILQNTQAKMEVKLLEDQINPHFLFNNLNILSTIINKGKSKDADQFLNTFSRIYRYVIDYKNQELILLSKELEFVKDYIYLLEKRFVNSYTFNINIAGNEETKYYIIPNTLQILVENIVKHNEGSSDHPVEVFLDIQEDHLVIKNTYSPKKYKPESKKIGLSNLKKKRYRLLYEQEISITQYKDYFIVNIPLVIKHI
ncbi:hypothetical protein GCM10022258_04080 [Aquimarina gracilis]